MLVLFRCQDAYAKVYYNRVNRCAGRLFIDILDLYYKTPLGVKSFVMLCVDDLLRYTLVPSIKRVTAQRGCRTASTVTSHLMAIR